MSVVGRGEEDGRRLLQDVAWTCEGSCVGRETLASKLCSHDASYYGTAIGGSGCMGWRIGGGRVGELAQ